MGNLKLPGFGNASAVLYDGSSFQPYILATRSDGSNGIIYGLFSQETESFSSQGTRFPNVAQHANVQVI
jgi:Cortical protein marker for cell polarity